MLGNRIGTLSVAEVEDLVLGDGKKISAIKGWERQKKLVETALQNGGDSTPIRSLKMADVKALEEEILKANGLA